MDPTQTTESTTATETEDKFRVVLRYATGGVTTANFTTRETALSFIAGRRAMQPKGQERVKAVIKNIRVTTELLGTEEA